MSLFPWLQFSCFCNNSGKRYIRTLNVTVWRQYDLLYKLRCFTDSPLRPTYPLPHSTRVPRSQGPTISLQCLIPLLHIHCCPLLDEARPGAFCPRRPSCCPVAYRRDSGLGPSPPSFLPLPGESRGWAPWLWKGTPGRTDAHDHAYTLSAHARVYALLHLLTHTHRYTHLYTHIHTVTRNDTHALPHAHSWGCAEQGRTLQCAFFGSFPNLSSVAYHVPCPVHLGQQGVWCNWQTNRQMTKLAGAFCSIWILHHLTINYNLLERYIKSGNYT
jgi:hypothetical protein